MKFSMIKTFGIVSCAILGACSTNPNGNTSELKTLDKAAEMPSKITCDFTEPFITYTYQVGTNVLTIDNTDETTSQKSNLIKTSEKKMSIVISKQASIELTLDYEGNNGMSDHTYPYSAIRVSHNGDSKLYGGCYSNLLEATLDEDLDSGSEQNRKNSSDRMIVVSQETKNRIVNPLWVKANQIQLTGDLSGTLQEALYQFGYLYPNAQDMESVTISCEIADPRNSTGKTPTRCEMHILDADETGESALNVQFKVENDFRILQQTCEGMMAG